MVYSLFLVVEARVLAASRSKKETPLTHTTYRGSDHICDPVLLPTPSPAASTSFSTLVSKPDLGQYPWKQSIVTTVFWIGEEADRSNPVPNSQSAWDGCWGRHYGGCDSPTERLNFKPATFVPNQNPFYVALPYNDLCHGHTKSQAAQLIPWFKSSFVRDGQSVCKDHWVAIRHGSRTCYAQWEDVGPFRVDHWQYVFGNERPHPNPNHGAGLDVSPAVRDYLGMSGMDVCDWKFVDLDGVPNGPWALYGDNNTVTQLRRYGGAVIARKHSRCPDPRFLESQAEWPHVLPSSRKCALAGSM
jgi:hypothetical protein